MTLDEWNRIRAAQLPKPPEPMRLACKCGGTMTDLDPGAICMSDPPQVTMQCKDCGKISWRLA